MKARRIYVIVSNVGQRAAKYAFLSLAACVIVFVLYRWAPSDSSASLGQEWISKEVSGNKTRPRWISKEASRYRIPRMSLTTTDYVQLTWMSTLKSVAKPTGTSKPNLKPVKMKRLTVRNTYRKPAIEKKYVKGRLKTAGRLLTIFLHGDDDFISTQLLRYQTFHDSWLRSLETFILRNPTTIQLLDVGCNVGVFTLTAAALGTYVVAIDANVENTDRLVQSVMANGFDDHVMVACHAVSNHRGLVGLSHNPNNIGGQQLIEGGDIRVVTMDDLVPLFDRDKDLIIKMDIEGHEARAMKAAAQLFVRLNVVAVIMEWAKIRKKREALSIVCFFEIRGYRAYSDFDTKVALDIGSFGFWPADILWRRPEPEKML